MTDWRHDLTNPFRKALARGETLLGIWSMLNAPAATEGLARAGYDWLLIDGEHAPITLPDMIGHLRILEPSPTVPVIRLPWNDRTLLKQHLDAGARTIMLPYVQTAEEARAAVAAMRYPPCGHRGIANIHRASDYGRITDYAARADETLFLVAQIETIEALDRVEEIAGVDGVDAVFFGPGDLAASMGLRGQAADARVTEAIEAARDQLRDCGKALGVLAPSPEIARRHVASGFDFVNVANDCQILFRGADTLLGGFRGTAPDAAAR